MLKCANTDPEFIKNVTADKTWFYNYDSETKSQSSLWKVPQSP